MKLLIEYVNEQLLSLNYTRLHCSQPCILAICRKHIFKFPVFSFNWQAKPLCILHENIYKYCSTFCNESRRGAASFFNMRTYSEFSFIHRMFYLKCSLKEFSRLKIKKQLKLSNNTSLIYLSVISVSNLTIAEISQCPENSNSRL